jgi:alpha-glucosidase (family GH31 glycosyl hydrolase)
MKFCQWIINQFDIGPSLLVAPVFVPLGEETEYYIPAGRWTSFFDSTRTIDGPKWVRECVPLDDIPVWVRPGTLLALGPDGIGRPDYDYTKKLELRAYHVPQNELVVVDVPVGKGVAIAGQAVVQGGVGLRVQNLEGCVFDQSLID